MSISDNSQTGKSKAIFGAIAGTLAITLAWGLGLFNRSLMARLPVVIGTTTMPAGGAGTTTPAQSITRGQYVASKNGKAYYLVSCSAAGRIAEKNKIWFETKDEAENAGYAPAKNCKEMQ